MSAADGGSYLYIELSPELQLPDGIYGVSAIWKKNEERSIARSMREGLFSVVNNQEETTDQGGAANIPVLKFHSSAGTFGYDGLSAYELALLKGLTTKSETEWVQEQLDVATDQIFDAKDEAVGQAETAITAAKNAAVSQAEDAVVAAKDAAVSAAETAIGESKENALDAIAEAIEGLEVHYDIEEDKGTVKDVQLKDGQGNSLMPKTKLEMVAIDKLRETLYTGFIAGKFWLPDGLTENSHFSAHTDLFEVKQGDVIIVENYRIYASATGGGAFCAIYPTNEGTGGTRYNCNDVLVPDPSVSMKYTFTVPKDGWIGVNIGAVNQSYINACRITHQYIEEGTLEDLLNEKVDKAEGKSLIDNEYADGVHYVENPEFAYLKTDADDAIIEGIKNNGKKYLPMPSNQDDILQRQIDSINEAIDKSDAKSNILPMFPQDGSIVFIAHRGVTLGGVANQYECFYQAHRFGFKYIEFDIQPTSDGKFVLAHNYTASLYYTYKDGSAIDDSVRIGDLTLDYILNNFIVKTSNEKMAHAPMDLETSLKLCRRWGLIPYIDIKNEIVSGTVTTNELDYIVNLATKYLGKCNFICTSYNASWLDYIRTLSEDYALVYYGGDGIAGTNRYTQKSRLTPRTTGVNYYGTPQAKLDAFIAYNEYAKSGNTEMDCDMKDPILFNQALDLGCRVFWCYNDPPLFTDNEISSEYGWDKFNYTGQLENDILNLDTSQYISKPVNIDSSYGAICIYLRFKGSISINVNGNSKTATYEDWNEWCFSYMMSKGETGEKTVLITALEPSSIYYLKVCYKNV